MIDSEVRRAPRLALILALPLALASHSREALASGWPHHAQAGVVVYAPVASPVHYAPVQYAPVQYAPTAQVQYAPVQYAPTAQVQYAPVQYAPTAQLQYAPVQYAPVQYAPVAPTQNAPTQNADMAAAPTDSDVLLLAQGLVRGGGSVENLRSRIRADVQSLLKNPALRKSSELVVPIALDLAKKYLRAQGFGFVIDESIEGILKKFAKQAIAEVGGAGTETADDAPHPPSTSGGVFEISGQITLRPTAGGGAPATATVQPTGSPDPNGGGGEPQSSARGYTFPDRSELAPDQ